jgi:NAD(P)-dependent dehydrogenase (short-subunit alcohol dehydrogenase family)
MVGKRVLNIDKGEPKDDWVNWVPCDLSSEGDIRVAVGMALESTDGQLNCLINCAGVNYNAWLEDTGLEDWERLFKVNVTAPFLLTQAFLHALTVSGGTVCNIVSNAAWVPMRASVAYNASKAAEHMLTLQMGRELTKDKGVTVFGFSPGKLKGTGMSRYIEQRVGEVRGWSPEFAQQYQANALTTGQEIEPDVLAELIVWLLSEKRRHFYLSGCLIPYGG